MKNRLFYLLTLLCLLVLNQNAAQVTFWKDDFESNAPTSGTRSAINHTDVANGTGPDICGPGNYFIRTNLASDAPNGLSITYAGFFGFYWRGEDLNNCVTDPDVIEFSNIDISGLSNFRFTGSFGANPAGLWDINDMDGLYVEYRVDRGPWEQNLTIIANTNRVLQQDTDLDGVPDGATLSPTLQALSQEFTASGTTLDLRIRISADDGSEEFAFDNFTLEHTVPLPVELSFFDGHQYQDHHVLSWGTTTEMNNYGFEVERSTDGINWIILGFVAGQGSSTENHQYQYEDAQPPTGINYYRLRQIDFDGSSVYSKVITLETPSPRKELQIYPNPATNILHVIAPTDGLLIITDAVGKVYQKFEVFHSELDVTNLLPGTYFLQLTTKDQMLSERFVKQ